MIPPEVQAQIDRGFAEAAARLALLRVLRLRAWRGLVEEYTATHAEHERIVDALVELARYV